LKKSFLKAEKFVIDYDFISLSHADKLIDWNQADKFHLIDDKLQVLN
ncbi:MAG: hypothetical protein HOH98_01995, partial [Flavobacteriaceae bacterium]|nr:hypothetical protein [Flavobacteriaceae bacterium]